jgi:hypothetical protein
MIVVALVGLNLAGVIATSKFYPRPMPPLPVTVVDRNMYIRYHGDGGVEEGVYAPETGYRRRTRVRRIPPRPTLLRIWTPVIGGATITLLAVVVAAWHSASSRHPPGGGCV